MDVTVRDKELDLADALMDTLGEVELEDLHDEYREALEEVIAAKAAGETPPEAPEPAAGGKVLDLMAALEKSVREARESRGEQPAPTEEAEVRPLARGRATPKETGGKKSTATAAKKTAAKKTTAAKTTAKTAAKKTTAAKTTAKSTAKSTAAKTTAKTTEKKTPAKKTPAKKTATRKRSA